MTPFMITESSDSSGHKIYSFSGSVNENLEITFPMTDVNLIFDLKEINQMNSSGILRFVKFLNSLRGDQTIRFINVPDFVVNVMSLTKGIVSHRFQIESFYVPFYCAEGDKQEYKLFHSKDLTKSLIVPYRDSEGKLFEVDTNLDRFLNFLNFQKS